MIFSKKIPSSGQFFELFETTGWNAEYELNSDELFKALKNSWYCISVYDDQKLIGFGRILCDGIMHALILDVIVHPDKQNEGIGKEVMNRLMKKCKQHNIRDIQLFCAKGKKAFYEKLGFESRDDESPGMQLKKVF